MIRFAERMNHLGTETAFEVLARARALEAQGRDMIHLEIGEPDFDTPENIRQAGEQALRDGWTHYNPSAGLPEARVAFAEYVQRTRAAEVSPDQVVITPGAKPIIFFSMLALLDAGDEARLDGDHEVLGRHPGSERERRDLRLGDHDEVTLAMATAQRAEELDPGGIGEREQVASGRHGRIHATGR